MARPFLTTPITDDRALGGSAIERSLRFDNASSARLTRTIGSTSNRRTYTYSWWLKRTMESAEQYVWYNGHASGTPYLDVRFEANSHELQISDYLGGSNRPLRFITNRKFRDCTGWYHFVIAIDTTQGTASNRVKLYVNGVQETSFSTETYPSQNFDTSANVSGNIQVWGTNKASTSNDLDGYLAEAHFVDGQQLTPSSFGYTDDVTGIWRPKKYEGTHGTNGFHLDFSDNSAATATTIGKDRSGNGNDFTPSNISVSSGTGNDSVLDTPSNNFATLNQVDTYGDGIAESISEANLVADNNSGSYRTTRSTVYVTSGKWYWEVKIINAGGSSGSGLVGVAGRDYVGGSGTRRAYSSNGNKYIGSGSSYGASWTTNDLIGVALDLEKGTITFYKNNVSQGVAFTDMLTTTAVDYDNDGWTPIINGYNNYKAAINFGQQPFTYTPPAGFKTLCSNNLLNHDTTSIINPKKHFECLLYVGDEHNYSSVTGLDFTPDFVWLKNRSHTSWHLLANSMFGFQNHSYTNSNLYSSYDLNANGYINPDPIRGENGQGGFSPNAQADRNTNNQGDNHVAWCWKGGSPNIETPTSGSVYFPEGNNYLDLGSYTDFQFGTGDYTIECWVYHIISSGQQTYLGDAYGNSAGVYFYKDSNHKLGMYYSGQIATGTVNIPRRQWVHIAASRSSGTLKLFQNGIEVGSGSDTTNLTETQLNVGDTTGGSSGSMHGYMSNVRVLKGTGLYTSNFTPPTSPLTNISNTVFLGCQSSSVAGLASVHPSTFSNNGTNYSSGSQMTGDIVADGVEGSGGKDSLFDGKIGEYHSNTYVASTVSTNTNMTWTPTSSISYSSKVEVWCYSPNGYGITVYYTLNGGSEQTMTVGGGSGFNNQTWITLATGSGTITSINMRIVRSGGSTSINWGAIRIDGSILVNDVTGKVVAPQTDGTRSLPVTTKNPFDGEFAIDGKRYLTAAAAGLSGGGKSPIAASINTKAGFGMITYISSAGNETIYHGLNQAPEIVFTKDVDNSRSTGVYYNLRGTNTNWMVLDSNAVQGSNNSGQTLGGVSGSYMYFHEDYIQPASSAFANGGNNADDQIIAYMWHSVPGYSKMGVYTGNGNGNGPYVHLGFKPALLIFKATNSAESWQIKDNRRIGYNDANYSMFPNNSNTDYTTAQADFLSKGFKWRSGGGGSNGGGETFIYMAFADESVNTPYQTESTAE